MRKKDIFELEDHLLRVKVIRIARFTTNNGPRIGFSAERQAKDREKSRQTAIDIVKTFPNLKGFIMFGSQGAPGAAQGLKELGLVDKIAVIGGGTPNEARPFVKDGSWDVVILWDSGDASYAMAYIAKLILDGKRGDIKTGINIPKIGVPQIVGKNILFDKPLILTKDNIDDYDF